MNTPSNFRAPVGMDFQELLDAAGGLKGTVEKVISGGPMMGFAMFDLSCTGNQNYIRSFGTDKR